MRIRSIKPDFWKSEAVAELSWEARFLWIGLWNYVDDNGVGRYNPKLIVAELFPLEDDPRETLARVSRGLEELSKRGRITIYEASDKQFLFVEGWDEHQRIDRPSKPRYPRPDEVDNPRILGGIEVSDLILDEPSRESRETLALGAVEQGNRGTGDQGELPCSANAEPSRLTNLEGKFSEFYETYPRRQGREAAKRKFEQALRRGVELETILAGARRYRDDPNRDQEFTAHPATWLNQGRWDDDPLPPRSSRETAARASAQPTRPQW